MGLIPQDTKVGLNAVAKRDKRVTQFFYCLAFYYKQMSFVENKFAKITREIHHREKSIEDMRKKKNSFTMLSSGSKKILDRKYSKSKISGSRNTSPSLVNIYTDDGKSSVPSSVNTQVHDRLYREQNIRELKKNILKQKYDGKYRRNHQSQQFVDITGKNSVQNLKNSGLDNEYKSPRASGTNYIHKKSSSNMGLAYRLSTIKGTGMQFSHELGRKRSPKQVSETLYQDAITRRKSKETMRSRQTSPNTEFKSSTSKYYLISKMITDFSESYSENNPKNSDDIDFLKTFEIMKRLGFIRQKEKTSQAEINSDKALFMDFWQELERNKNVGITKDMLFTY